MHVKERIIFHDTADSITVTVHIIIIVRHNLAHHHHGTFKSNRITAVSIRLVLVIRHVAVYRFKSPLSVKWHIMPGLITPLQSCIWSKLYFVLTHEIFVPALAQP